MRIPELFITVYQVKIIFLAKQRKKMYLLQFYLPYLKNLNTLPFKRNYNAFLYM